MGVRLIELNAGIETSTLPDAGVPVVDGDVVTKGYADDTYEKKVIVTGTFALPTSVSAGTTLAHNLTSGDASALIFVQGNGSPVDLSNNPQIAVPTAIGQRLTVVGCSDYATVKLEDGNGLAMNGEKILGARSMVTFIALTLTQWDEFGRP